MSKKHLRKEGTGQDGRRWRVDGGTSLRVGMTHELSQVGSVLRSCFFTGRNAAILFGKASEFSIYCEYLSKCSFKKLKRFRMWKLL